MKSRVDIGAPGMAATAVLLVLLIQSLGCSRVDSLHSDPSSKRITTPDGFGAAAGQRKSPNAEARPSAPLLAAHAGQPIPTEASPSIYLASEARFIKHGGLDSDSANEVLGSSDAFSRALNEMSAAAMTSTEAQDLADLYRRALAEVIGTDGAVVTFACGLSMCMGSVHTHPAVDSDSWTYRFLDAPSTRIFGHLRAVERIGNLTESRFIFSTDPDIPGIVVPHAD
ncbi:hypothetical protein [Stenotrophomonas sp. PD6]|uniref:hypothetical protein n=1 Tax=Stenotrophomonas sp. PD6 TaxID=3368612 RepID=UPI003B9F7BF4